MLIISVVIGRMGLCVLLDHDEDEVGYSRGAQRDAVRAGVLVTFLSSPSSLLEPLATRSGGGCIYQSLVIRVNA